MGSLDIIPEFLLAIAALIGVWWQGRKTLAEVASIRAEIDPHGSPTMRDQLNRVERRLTELAKSVGGIRDDARLDRADVRAHIDASTTIHADHATRIARLEGISDGSD